METSQNMFGLLIRCFSTDGLQKSQPSELQNLLIRLKRHTSVVTAAPFGNLIKPDRCSSVTSGWSYAQVNMRNQLGKKTTYGPVYRLLVSPGFLHAFINFRNFQT